MTTCSFIWSSSKTTHVDFHELLCWERIPRLETPSSVCSSALRWLCVWCELHPGQTWSLNKSLAPKGYLTTVLLSCLYSTQGTMGSFSVAEATRYCRNCTCTTVLIITIGLQNCQCISFQSQQYIHYCQILIFRERSQNQPFHTEN